MPDYVNKALGRLQHTKPKRPQYVPHHWMVPAYGKILNATGYKIDRKSVV